MAQRMTFGLFSGAASQRIEFVRMKGPRGTIIHLFIYSFLTGKGIPIGTESDAIIKILNETKCVRPSERL